MPETTLEEAKRCPKCQEPGEQTRVLGSRPGQTRGSQNYEFTCRNERCRWFEELYYVTVRPDGTIPEAYSSKTGSRKYPKMNVSRDSKEVVDSLQRQLELETNRDGTAEVRNPYR